MTRSRRHFLGHAIAGALITAVRPRVLQGHTIDAPLSQLVLRRALDALEHHRDKIVQRDIIGIADFSRPSKAPRLHLLNLANGSIKSHLVAHGRGSDPAHTGWLKRFSNDPRSLATSAGAFKTDQIYVGEHGQSLRLEGLDDSNSNAASRALVVHGAWYVSQEISSRQGVLGRSEGCFAVSQASIDDVLATLGTGRLIYADKA